MNYRTDLAVEAHEIEGGAIPGVTLESIKCRELVINKLRISTQSAAERLCKPQGTYITAEGLSLTEHFSDVREQTEQIAAQIRQLLPKSGAVLVTGIGNTSITPDSLGPESTKMILATRHISRELAKSTGLSRLRTVSVLSPGVLGQTGIEVGEIIISLSKRLEPSAVIAIDALASASADHLGKTIQISDSGIAPGSGVGNHRFRLNRETLGVPVIGIGVPTVVDSGVLASDISGKEVPPDSRRFMVTPREIDLLIQRASKLIGMAVNCALQPEYSFDELAALVS